MKTLQRLCMAFVLTLALTIPAFAGGIETGVTPPPPLSDAATTGDIETGITGDIQTGVTDPVTETALSLLQSVLSLF